MSHAITISVMKVTAHVTMRWASKVMVVITMSHQGITTPTLKVIKSSITQLTTNLRCPCSMYPDCSIRSSMMSCITETMSVWTTGTTTGTM